MTRPMPRVKRKGRSVKDARHLRLYDYMLTSAAYLSLSCPARAVLIEIARIYDGLNNGSIALSVRMAAQRCRIAQGTATRAFRELIERGFIECLKPGSFDYKKRHAAEWRITWKPCDVTGTLSGKQFMRWRAPEKQNTVSKQNATVLSFGTATKVADLRGH